MENVTGESSPATTRLIEVLVVSDEEDTRVILHDYFSAHGFHVRAAATGEAALAELAGACPDAMVLDIRMPKVDLDPVHSLLAAHSVRQASRRRTCSRVHLV